VLYWRNRKNRYSNRVHRANFDLDFELDDYQFSKEEQLMLKHERRGAGRIIDGKQNKSVRDKDKDIHTEKFS
jgi:hypothetical protein